MKKGLIVLTMLVTFMLAPIVRADTTYYTINVNNYNFTDFLEITYNNNKLYEELLNIYNNSEKEYYMIFIDETDFNPSTPKIYLSLFDDKNIIGSSQFENEFGKSVDNCIGYRYFEDNINSSNKCNWNIKNNNYYSLIDTNYNFISYKNYSITGLTNSNIEISQGTTIPSLNEIANPRGYIEVNLDNYEYVLLSLKNYNQTKAFQTNLQVKGQIGITPIYNYGQTTKDSITGVQVQDRCNVNYNNYTNYPFYILQQDLQNNVIYAVKECTNGSSFKFDNSIFDITYVTEENKNNPTVTINGKTYDVIPYGDLPSTATKNEQENYIPGESGNASDTGGLDNAIKTAQQKMSEIWNTFTYFTDFINQIFSSLPEELRVILISAFTIMIVIGLIKIFVN